MSEVIRFTQMATVAKVIDEYTVIINKGAADGIRDGARFLIYGLGDEILDPETHESLGNLELVRGIGVAQHIQDKMTTVKSAKTKNPTPTIKTVKRSPRGMGLSLMGALGDEIIEERQGEPTILPFDGARTGDRAKPL